MPFVEEDGTHLGKGHCGLTRLAPSPALSRLFIPGWHNSDTKISRRRLRDTIRSNLTRCMEVEAVIVVVVVDI